MLNVRNTTDAIRLNYLFNADTHKTLKNSSRPDSYFTCTSKCVYNIPDLIKEHATVQSKTKLYDFANAKVNFQN